MLSSNRTQQSWIKWVGNPLPASIVLLSTHCIYSIYSNKLIECACIEGSLKYALWTSFIKKGWVFLEGNQIILPFAHFTLAINIYGKKYLRKKPAPSFYQRHKLQFEVHIYLIRSWFSACMLFFNVSNFK